MVKSLIKKRSNVNLCDAKGWTAAHFAAMNGHWRVCDSLLAAKADATALTSHGCSIAYYAARYCGDDASIPEQIKLLKRLREAGEDFSARYLS